MARVYVRDLEQLLALRQPIGNLSNAGLETIRKAAKEIADIKEELFNRRNYWQAELRRREARLSACFSDKENHGCSTEAAAVRQAQESIEKLGALMQRFEQVAGEYQVAANRMQQILDQKIGKAKSELDRIIYRYQGYLAGQARQTRAAGFNTHGSDYKRERHKFILNTIHEDPSLSNTSSLIRNDLLNKVRSKGESGYIRSTKGYHVGHLFSGWNHWSNYRWEESGMNMSRGGKYKR